MFGWIGLVVSFLHSYINPTHEERVREIAAKNFPNLLVSLSSDLVPQFREYERTSTTVLNAFVRPAVLAYLAKLETGLVAMGIETPLLVMQSSGGIVSAETAQRQPVSLARSGPAAGGPGAAGCVGAAGSAVAGASVTLRACVTSGALINCSSFWRNASRAAPLISLS